MRPRGSPRVLLPALAAVIAAGAVASPAVARRMSDRPPPAHTGGFGEPTCAACHFDTQVDDGRGTIDLTGLPAVYVPGQTYVLTVSLSHPELGVGGFQLSARHAEGARQGMQAGTMRSLDPRVDVTSLTERPVQYARHTFDGTRTDSAGVRRLSWRVEWTAPANGGDVAFHVAANAANDDASPLGDFVYTRAFGARATREK